jgi:hypothetical protein
VLTGKGEFDLTACAKTQPRPQNLRELEAPAQMANASNRSFRKAAESEPKLDEG